MPPPPEPPEPLVPVAVVLTAAVLLVVEPPEVPVDAVLATVEELVVFEPPLPVLVGPAELFELHAPALDSEMRSVAPKSQMGWVLVE
jgi:hypothetical protein